MILNKKSIANYEQQLFQSELEKYRFYQNRLIQASHKQSALMKELTAKFNSLLQDKRVRAEQSKYEAIQRQRATVINKYKRAYQEFLDLEAGLQSAKRWYSEMKQTVESLEKNVETFVNNRRSEGAQLLNEIERERTSNKSTQAALEQGRLKGLMERMSMEPPPSSPKPPGSSRPTPAPLSFSSNSNTTPSYPKTNFSGQYQVPNSPPAHQSSTPQPYGQGYGQLSYNPSTHGRIPGPASPPPTQTGFNVRAGPASPPATQSSFSQNPRTYSTYGNPAAAAAQQQQHQQQPPQPQHPPQQHSFAPPGFVPPPPPPGPPPLGPQQTFHYNSNDYYNATPKEGRPASGQIQPQMQMQQQPHQHQSSADPWAGLSAWR